VKLWGGSKVVSGNIIVTQRGTRYRPGEGVKIARNHTLFSVLGKHDEGEEYVVKYEKVVHNTKQRNLVSVVKRKDYNFGSASAPVFLGTTKEQKAIRVARALEKTALLMAEAQRSRLGGEGKFATSHI
jgi:large subunit ribosomal protein L27|tara:strand:+ start:139 stop:522 length:384 start_codon:yes stop_codon:yes gene_type:complete